MEKESNQSPEEKQQDSEKEKVEEEGDLVWEQQCRITEMYYMKATIQIQF